MKYIKPESLKFIRKYNQVNSGSFEVQVLNESITRLNRKLSMTNL